MRERRHSLFGASGVVAVSDVGEHAPKLTGVFSLDDHSKFQLQQISETRVHMTSNEGVWQPVDANFSDSVLTATFSNAPGETMKGNVALSCETVFWQDGQQWTKIPSALEHESGWNAAAGSAEERATAERELDVQIVSDAEAAKLLWANNAWTPFERRKMEVSEFTPIDRNIINTSMQGLYKVSTASFVFERDVYVERGPLEAQYIIGGYVSRTQRVVRVNDSDEFALIEAVKHGHGYLIYTYQSQKRGKFRVKMYVDDKETLLSAAMAEDWPRVQELLSDDAKIALVQEKNDEGRMTLHLALITQAAPKVTMQIFQAHTEAARVEDRDGNLPLHLALAYKADPELTRQLVDANPQATGKKDGNGDLPLHLALVTRAALETTTQIFQAHTEAARAEGRDGNLPLHLALKANAATDVTVQVLEAYQQAAREKDHEGQLPLLLAARYASQEVFEQVLEVYPQAAQEKDNQGNLPLHFAVARTDIISKQTFEAYPDAVRERNDEGNLPLHLALEFRKQEVQLIVFDAYPQAATEKNGNRNLPLHLALMEGAASEVTMKIFHAFPQAAREKSVDGNLPLHYALQHQAAPGVTMQLLEAYGDAAQQEDTDGRLPLQLALQHEASPEVTGRLFELHPQSARPEDWQNEALGRAFKSHLQAAQQKDVDGRLPLHYALQHQGAPGVTMQLLEAYREAAQEEDTDGRLPLQLALQHEASPEVTGRLFEVHPQAARPDDWQNKALGLAFGAHALAAQEEDTNGRLPLHTALMEGAASEVTMKIFHAFPQAAREKSVDGNLPLHYALQHQAAPGVTMQLLEAYREAAQQEDTDGRLPLQLALQHEASPGVTRKVLEAHKEATQQKRDGRLPLHLALEHGAAREVTDRILNEYKEGARETCGTPAMLPLLLALKHNAAPEVTLKLLKLSKTATAKTCDVKNWPLHLAIKHNAAPEVTLQLLNSSTAKNQDAEKNLPLHLALKHNATPEVTVQVLNKYPEAAETLDGNGNLALHLALKHNTAPEATVKVVEAYPEAALCEDSKGQTIIELALQRMPALRDEMLQRCRDAANPASLCDQLRVRVSILASQVQAQSLTPLLRLSMAQQSQLETELRECCKLMRAALCSPDERLQISAASLLQTLCNAQEGAHIKMVLDQPGIVERLVKLLAVGATGVPRHAATVLGQVAHVNKEQMAEHTKDAKVEQMLAVLSSANDKTVKQYAESILENAGHTPDAIKKLAERGHDAMFAKPWPSQEFMRYEQEQGWKKPPKSLRDGDGKKLVGWKIFVEGHGEGTVDEFHKNTVFADEHTVAFDLAGLIKVKLRRGKNKERRWLIPRQETANDTQKRLRNYWTDRGGKAMTTRVYTRGASVYDVCAWLQSYPDEAGVRCFYAGLIAEHTFHRGKRKFVLNGEEFLKLNEVALVEKLGVTNAAHCEELMKSVTELQGYLGRYLLDRGRSVHRSATCVLIFAEDRETVLEDGSLQRVAIKCMRNLEQFETEVRKRHDFEQNQGQSGTKSLEIAQDIENEVKAPLDRGSKSEFDRYEHELGWREPPKELRNANGWELVGKKVFVQNHGEGTIVDFHKVSNKAVSSQHSVEFDGQTSKIKLRRKTNKELDWLIPPVEGTAAEDTTEETEQQMQIRSKYAAWLKRRAKGAQEHVVSALRVHTPTVQSTDKAKWAFKHIAVTTELEDTGRLLRERVLDNPDHPLIDERVRGYPYVIVMECADCDLKSDISHGHYAGRDKQQVQNKLRQVARCFQFLERLKLIHGDVKPMNIVLKGKNLKMIDFDASAAYNELCHLKYSSSYAPPQLAHRLLEYDDGPVDEWATFCANLKPPMLASVATDMWGFGVLLYQLCMKDSAHIFLSTEADNIVKKEDLTSLAYHWEQRKLEEALRIEWVEARDLVLWCLQTDPERRPQSFEDVLRHRFLQVEEQQTPAQQAATDAELPDPELEPESTAEQLEAAPQPEHEAQPMRLSIADGSSVSEPVPELEPQPETEVHNLDQSMPRCATLPKRSGTTPRIERSATPPGRARTPPKAAQLELVDEPQPQTDGQPGLNVQSVAQSAPDEQMVDTEPVLPEPQPELEVEKTHTQQQLASEVEVSDMHPAAEPAELQTAPSSLRYLSSVDEDWIAFIRRQSAALHRAIDAGSVSRVKVLFERGGVHIGLRAQLIGPTMGGTGMLPLHRSARVGSAEAVQILRYMLNEIPDYTPLKDKRAILDAHVGYGYTAYMVACEFGNLQAVELLVNAGCSTSLKNSFGQTGLELAVANGQSAIDMWLQGRVETHAALRGEFERRNMRPDVQSHRRDELEIAAERLTFWEVVLDEFETWQRIGGGAYGDIYVVPMFPPLQLGNDGSGEPAMISTVVVKSVAAADNEEALAALRDEIKALCSLNHANIVRVYGFSFTPRPINSEDQESAASLRDCGKTEDCDEMLGAVRLARESSKLSGGAAKDPKTFLATSAGREVCKKKGVSAKQPSWALLLEKCDCDLAAPIYNQHPWDDEGAVLSWVRRLDFAQQMTSGLAYIHANGQVHWDLKPGNILMKRRADDEWTLKIADFGMGDKAPTLQKWLMDKDLESISVGFTTYLSVNLPTVSSETPMDDEMLREFVENKDIDKYIDAMAETNQWNESETKKFKIAMGDLIEPVGTPEYMAPEAWRGCPEAASDVFSFGLILWELCTQKRVHKGFPPFDLQHHTVDEHIPMWMATKDARPDIPPGCPKPWALLMQACWAAEPAMRPTFDDIAAALRAMIPLVDDWAATHTVAAESTATTTAPTVQQWMETLGLGTKVEAFVSTSGLQEGNKYLDGVKTTEDEEFQELLEDLEDLDEAVDEMVGEDDDGLTEEEAAKLKAALRAETLQPPTSLPEWLEALGLQSKLDVLESYVSGAETVADERFMKFAQDGDNYVNEMQEEGDLTPDEATKLKKALSNPAHHGTSTKTGSKPALPLAHNPWKVLRSALRLQPVKPLSQVQEHELLNAIQREHPKIYKVALEKLRAQPQPEPELEAQGDRDQRSL